MSVEMSGVSCPCCRRRVDVLTTQNWTNQQKASASGIQLLARVREFNSKFSNEPRSWSEMLRDTPVLLSKLWRDFLAEPGRALKWLIQVRVLFALITTFTYLFSPIDLIPELLFGIAGFVDDIFLIALAGSYLATIYRSIIIRRQGGN